MMTAKEARAISEASADDRQLEDLATSQIGDAARSGHTKTEIGWTLSYAHRQRLAAILVAVGYDVYEDSNCLIVNW